MCPLNPKRGFSEVIFLLCGSGVNKIKGFMKEFIVPSLEVVFENMVFFIRRIALSVLLKHEI